MNELCYVVCLLKGAWPQIAPALGEEYVYRLKAGVEKYADGHPIQFACFTDRDNSALPGVELRALPAGYDTWFNKLYLFGRDAFAEGSRVLYLDLDTVLIDRMSPLLSVPLDKPVFLWDQYHNIPRRIAAGVVAFRSGPALYPIWDEFKHRYRDRPPPYLHCKPHPMMRIPSWNGRIRDTFLTEEDWVHRFMYPDNFAFWNEVTPASTVLSYKWDVLGKNPRRIRRPPIPGQTALYFFHGRPRPHEVRQFWEEPASARCG